MLQDMDANKELKTLQKHLKTRPDAKLINGYKHAMQDYKETGDEQCKLAGDLTEKELKDKNIPEELYKD